MKKRPNILLIMTDEQRFDAVGYRNPEVHTPEPGPPGAGKRAVYKRLRHQPPPASRPGPPFYGRYPSQCGAPTYMTPPAEKRGDLYEPLRAGGHTAVVGKQHFWRQRGGQGLRLGGYYRRAFPARGDQQGSWTRVSSACRRT